MRCWAGVAKKERRERRRTRREDRRESKTRTTIWVSYWLLPGRLSVTPTIHLLLLLSCYLRFRNATTTYHSLTSCKSLSLALIGMHANVIRRSRGKETRMGNEREREWHKHRNNVSLVSKVYGIYRVPLINKWLTFRFVMWARVHVRV